MNAVFLGGSRRVSRLNQAIRRRLDQIIGRNLPVFIGDANGADKAMQRYFAESKYRNVVVYAVASHLRNNLGSWPVELIPSPPHAKGRDLFSVKDRAMAERAMAGLMLWDGHSRGTLANIRNLLVHGKPVAVYYSPKHRFLSLRTVEEFIQYFPRLSREFPSPLPSRADSTAEQHAFALAFDDSSNVA